MQHLVNDQVHITCVAKLAMPPAESQTARPTRSQYEVLAHVAKPVLGRIPNRIRKNSSVTLLML